MYIAIAGNIGSGKTSLTNMLAERLGARIYEEDINNPYLNDFYKDMNRWSFNLQMYFLGSRIRQAAQMLAPGGNLVQDRTVYEDAHIFATNLHEMGLMTTRDFNSYMRIFDIASHMIPVPDLLVYLKASVPKLVEQISRRGRDYEMTIERDYLARLNEKYDNWIENIYQGEVVVLDMDNEDFLSHPEVVDRIVARAREIEASRK